jgi:hypothetical protein
MVTVLREVSSVTDRRIVMMAPMRMLVTLMKILTELQLVTRTFASCQIVSVQRTVLRCQVTSVQRITTVTGSHK